jgi:hypothetical protein
VILKRFKKEEDNDTQSGKNVLSMRYRLSLSNSIQRFFDIGAERRR